MKNKLFIITLLLMYMNVFSQDVYQETNLEFGNAMNSQESYLCEATTSIRLLPGFAYKPVEDKSMPSCNGHHITDIQKTPLPYRQRRL